MTLTDADLQNAIQTLDQAQSAGTITPAAVVNIKRWLTEERYALYQQEVVEHIQGGKWKALDDAFWTIIPFGTGGRRGRMFRLGRTRSTTALSGKAPKG